MTLSLACSPSLGCHLSTPGDRRRLPGHSNRRYRLVGPSADASLPVRPPLAHPSCVPLTPYPSSPFFPFSLTSDSVPERGSEGRDRERERERDMPQDMAGKRKNNSPSGLDHFGGAWHAEGRLRQRMNLGGETAAARHFVSSWTPHVPKRSMGVIHSLPFFFFFFFSQRTRTKEKAWSKGPQ
ncbi:hypothetical protein LY78DRAFT_144092 [Colletotrichum sublineola]|nr:hypothetical protein LY78DRAFT_144092 [Colletotrichum sublineola]